MMKTELNKQMNNIEEQKQYQQNWYYERFIDMMAFMIQKYGHIVLEKLDEKEKNNNGEENK